MSSLGYQEAPSSLDSFPVSAACIQNPLPRWPAGGASKVTETRRDEPGELHPRAGLFGAMPVHTWEQCSTRLQAGSPSQLTEGQGPEGATGGEDRKRSRWDRRKQVPVWDQLRCPAGESKAQRVISL